ncbi:MAG: hypothetical protein M9883_17495 [Methylobacteriaceae bacterium]|nr:hypothetical protein [Methylobacteriaceae bacterium]
MARRVDAARVVEEKPAQAQTPPGPLDLWEEEEVAQWAGLVAGDARGLRQFMSDDEATEYVEQTLARERRAERGGRAWRHFGTCRGRGTA